MSSLKKSSESRGRLHRSATLDPSSGDPQTTKGRSSSQRIRKPMSQSLVDLVTCAICLEQLKRPTMLPCQHTFCLHCLQTCVKDKLLRIACPTCRSDVQLPPQGVAGLPKNMSLEAFLEVLKAGNPTEARSTKPSTAQEGACSRCLVQDSSEVTCHHCKKKFCRGCRTLHVKDITDQLNSLVTTVKTEQNRLALLNEDFKERCEKLEQNIMLAAEIRVQKILEDQSRLLKELKTWQESAEGKSIELRQKCAETLALLRLNQETIQSGTETHETAVLPRDGIFGRAEEVLLDAKSHAENRLIFDEVDFKLCYGNEEEPSSPGIVTDGKADGAAAAAAEEEAAAKRKVQFREQSHSVDGSAPLVKEVKPKMGLPTTPDEQSLFYRCKSSSPKARFSPTLLERPAGVAISPWTGDTYVAATDSHRVYVLDKHGRIIKSLGSPYHTNTGNSGSPNGTFLCPFGIAFSTATEQIYVTDKWLNCVQVFDKEGNYLHQLGAKGTSAGHFRSPEGIAIDARGFIYVCDTCNDRVQILDKRGVFVRELGVVSQMTLPGGKRYQKREFNEPTGVAVTTDGSRVAVCDYGNCRVRVFGPSGEKITEFGFRGTQRGQFLKPECVAIDHQGFILVGDNGNARVQIFRPNGNFVRMIGTKGTGPGQFSSISGIALTNELDIVVADFKNHCVQVF